MFRLVGIIASLAGLVAVDNINRGIRWGAGVFGFLKAWRQNFRERRQERRARKRGQALPAVESEGSMAINLGTRTSTNAGVAGLAVVWACQLVEQVAPGLLGAKADDYLIVAIAWLVARFSTTPAEPKVL